MRPIQRSLTLVSSLLISASAAIGAEFKGHIEYTRAGNTPMRLDASVPDGAGPFPVVILIHGGGWSSGNKRGDVTPFMEPLTQAGFTWFSIDYRLAPTNPWPACFEDIQASIRWVKAHASEFKGDSNRIAILGYSAGGHLACHAAVMADDSTRVQAVVGCAAPTDHIADSERRGGISKSMQNLLGSPPEMGAETRRRLREFSPINYVKPGLPPFFLIAGTADTSVPYSQSTNFQARLMAAGVPCELITLTNATHRLRDWKNVDAGYEAKMIGWLKGKIGAARLQD